MPNPASKLPTRGPVCPKIALSEASERSQMTCSHVPSADSEPVDSGDNRLGDHAYHGVQLRDAELGVAGVVLVAVLAAYLLIAPARERLVARAREDHDAHRIVLPRVLERADHLVDRQRSERVAHLRTVDGDRGDAAALLVEDVRVFHSAKCTCSDFRGQPRRSRVGGNLASMRPADPFSPREKARMRVREREPRPPEAYHGRRSCSESPSTTQGDVPHG